MLITTPTFSKMDLAAGSAWKTVTTSEQTFSSRNWTGTFTPVANGSDTDMTIEILWTAGASPLGQPITEPSKIGFSSFNSGLQFAPAGNKARIFSILLEFVDISQIVAPNNSRLNCGLWLGEATPAAATATTSGVFYGGEVSDAFADFNYNQFSMESLTAANLINTGGDTIDPTIKAIYLQVMIIPTGQMMIVQSTSVNAMPTNTFNLNKTRTNNGSTFQNPSAGADILFGVWFGTNRTTTGAGTNYEFTYKLRYAYSELE